MTARVTVGTIGGALRTTGRVAVDETRVHRVNVKFGGFVEQVHADFVGQLVQQGGAALHHLQPRAAGRPGGPAAGAEDAEGPGLGPRAGGGRRRPGGRGAAQAPALGRPGRHLARIEQTGEAQRTVTVVSPTSGRGGEEGRGARHAARGRRDALRDLGPVHGLGAGRRLRDRPAAVKVGAPATLTFKALPGREYQGRIAFIDPVLDPKTRTAKVRVSLANPGGDLLKPEMFGEVVLRTAPRQALRIPADAVIDSGTRSVVFVALGDGKFQPRVVRLGGHATATTSRCRTGWRPAIRSSPAPTSWSTPSRASRLRCRRSAGGSRP